MSDRTVAPGATNEGEHARKVSVRVLLLLVVLVPTVGMLVIAGFTASRARSERDAATRLQRGAAHLESIIEGRAAIADEEVPASVLTIAADLGVGAAEVSTIYGVDYVAQLDAARQQVDADPMLESEATVARSLADLRALRPGIDAGTVTFAELAPVIRAVREDLDVVWSREFTRQAVAEASDLLPATIHVALDALNDAYLALAAGSDRATFAIQLLSGAATDESRADLLDAGTRFEAAVEALSSHLGPRGGDAWRAHTASAASRRFEATLEDAAALALSGQRSPLADDPGALGDALIDGDPWSMGLTDTVRAAAADLLAAGRQQAADASRDLRLLEALSALVVLVSIGGAIMLAKVVTGPVRRLEAAAQQVQAGHFDLTPIEVRGPRELADTASAFNEMARTLAAVEANAVALADDPEAPVLGDPLPGRTGRALQVALNRLRSSIQMAEEHRRELQRAATHDDLTGLINRAAATEVVERDLARVARDGGTVAALFIDLDGLKSINDAHGHAAGDDALRLAADALRAATRTADVVARLSGDEFLVAGVVHDIPAEIDALAQRVHHAIAEQVLECGGESIPLRSSVGIAMASPDDTVQSLINKADSALYTAKRKGRDRIAWHHDPETAQDETRP